MSKRAVLPTYRDPLWWTAARAVPKTGTSGPGSRPDSGSGYLNRDRVGLSIRRMRYDGHPHNGRAYAMSVPRSSRRQKHFVYSTSGADLTFATHLAARSRSECQIQSSTRIQYLLVVL